MPGLQDARTCVECPPCVTCPGGGDPPQIRTGYSLSPLGVEIWAHGLQTDTSKLVDNWELLSTAVNGVSSETHDLVNIVNLMKQQARHRERVCAHRKCASSTEALTYRDGYCDFNASSPAGQYRCIPALHSMSLNISLFKCPVFFGGQSPNSSCVGPTPSNSSGINETTTTAKLLSTVKNKQCSENHDGPLCSQCVTLADGKSEPSVVSQRRGPLTSIYSAQFIFEEVSKSPARYARTES
eukprot:COSAG05_NODE_1089_length_5920_cov_2.369009_5_plen_240_part_00